MEFASQKPDEIVEVVTEYRALVSYLGVEPDFGSGLVGTNGRRRSKIARTVSNIQTFMLVQPPS
jgi:hypothetical protein